MGRVVVRSPTPAWHRHVNLKCVRCGVVVYPRATCVMRGGSYRCPVPSATLCAEHRRRRTSE